MSPRPPRPPPRSFTGSAAAGARRGHRCRPGRPGPYRGRSPAAPLLVPAADTDVTQAVPASTEAVHRQHRCCYLPWTRYCPTDVTQAVPAPTVVVHRQRRCWCPPRTPMSPRPSRPLPWSFSGSAAAGARRGHRCRPGRPGLSEAVRRQHRCCRQRTRRHSSHRGRSPAAPLLLVPAADPLLPRRCQSGRPGRHRRCSPAAPLLLPAAVPPLPHRCRAGRPGRHRGCSPAAPLLLPAADPLLPPPPIEAVHRHHRCCCPPAADPMCSTDANQAVPADSTADDHRCSRCCGLLPPRCCPTDVPRKAPGYLCRCSMKIAPTCPIKIYTIFRNWGEYRYYISKDRIYSSYLNRCP